jgi:hypothetical protein
MQNPTVFSAPKKELPQEQRQKFFGTLRERFEINVSRHRSLEWGRVQVKLEGNSEKLWVLGEMERTGGEPDVVGYDEKTGEYIFVDCSAETPKGRRNVCYDGQGQAEREKHGVHPAGNAVDLAAAMGIELLDEAQYRELQ